jgi:uncharacterized membrane protein YeaQ/YmgE (transglycosylase-associated protein family)
MFGLFMSAIIGVFAGWLAEQMMKRQHGLLTNLVVGGAGGLVGGFLIGLLGMGPPEGFIARVACATGGAVVLLWALDKLRANKKN